MVFVLLLIAQAWSATIPVLRLDGSVDAGSADYLVQGIHTAETDGSSAVVIEIDTPGGLVSSAREIVQAELNASIPVIVYVSPSGGRAASAGVFLTMAGHVAAMAPGTTIGAAHPVNLFGGDDKSAPSEPSGEDSSAESEPSGSSVMEDKILNDTVAWARSIAEQRERNADWAERAVRESVAVTDVEALELGVIDRISPTLQALLDEIDGQAVDTRQGRVVLQTAGATLVAVPMDLRQRVVHFLGDPNVLFVLVALGLLGLYTEFHNPGLVLPGALGALMLIVSGVGLSILPFNLGGLLLVVLAFVLFALEFWIGAFGAFALGGAGSLVLGGVLMFDVVGLDLRVDLSVLLGVAGVAGGLAVAVGYLIARAHQIQPSTGSEGMVGLEGEVITGGVRKGRVRLQGEDWVAHWAGELSPGDRVGVVRVDNLRVEVKKLTGEPQGPLDSGG